MNSLCRLLEERGLSQTQLARMSGVNRELICKVALGKRKFGRSSILAALAYALQVEARDLEDVYDGHQPLPIGPYPEQARPKKSLPGAPLSRAIKDRLATVPYGEKGRYLLDRQIPDPHAIKSQFVSVRKIENTCDRLGLHPVDLYGDAYYSGVSG